MTKTKMVLTNVELTDAQWDLYNKKREHLAEIAKIDAQFKSDDVVFSTSSVDIFLDAATKKIDSMLINSKVIMSAARRLLAGNINAVLALAEVTRHTVRLYSLEGKHLSSKHGEQTRMTWYTNPVTAVELGEYMGGLTGKLVYIDMELDYCSDYSHRFYKRGDEAIILKGDLIKVSKRKFKYAKSSGVTEVAAGEEVQP